MNPDKANQRLEQIEKRTTAITATLKRMEAKRKELRTEESKLRQEARRLRLVALIGQQVKCVQGADRKLGTRPATLVKVRRTRCTLDYGADGRFNVPMNWVIGANVQPGDPDWSVWIWL